MDNILLYILFFTFIGSLFSLIGGVFLLLKDKLVLRASHILTAFAAGALLSTAFFDLLPESLEAAEELSLGINVFQLTLLGILGFFLLERFIHFFHHHGHPHQDELDKPIVPLIILGDSLHNFADGVAIAAAFLVSIPLGMVTAFAVAAHEIPQEIGDFGVLLNQGLNRAKVLWLNIFSAVTAFLGAILAFYLGEIVEGVLPVILSLTAGFFIYIALADLIPEIHEKKRGFAFWEVVFLFVGVLVVYLGVTLLEGQIAH